MRCLLLLTVLSLCAGSTLAGTVPDSMVVGDRALELVENRQLSFRVDGPASGVWLSPNGAKVACLFESDSQDKSSFSIRMCSIPSSGGRVVPLMSCSRKSEDDIPPGYDQWCPRVYPLHEPGVVSWSPNSRLIAFPAIHVTRAEVDGDNIVSEGRFIVVAGDSGARRATFALSNSDEMRAPVAIVQADTWAATFALSDSDEMHGPIFWSHDSGKLACVLYRTVPGPQDEVDKDVFDLCVFDVASGTAQTVHTSGNDIELIGWHSEGKSLLCNILSTESVWQVSEVSVADGSVRTVMERQDRGRLSPDGKYLLLSEGPGMRVEDTATGKALDIVESDPYSFIEWSPDSRMFAYRRKVDVEDDHRKGRLDMLWIACVEDHKANHMCVTLDEDFRTASWSDNCRKLAYISRNRAYVAEMAWRAPNSSEKLDAGIPLSEEEEKDMMVKNASQLGHSILVSASDRDGTFPSAESFRNDIEPYLGGRDVMLRPGTDQYIVQYFPQPPIGQIESPSDTILAILDAGYGWQVVIYVDGHVKVVPKQ